jgi:transposase
MQRDGAFNPVLR